MDEWKPLLLGDVPDGWEQHTEELRREREAAAAVAAEAEATAAEEAAEAEAEEADLAAELRRERVELTLRLRASERDAAAAAAAGAPRDVVDEHQYDVAAARAAIEATLGADEAAEAGGLLRTTSRPILGHDIPSV